MEKNDSFKNKMELKFPIVIYSHSSYSDVWPLILGQFEKFMSNQKIYLFTDQDPLKGDYDAILYDDDKNYNERMLQCLKQIKETILLFTHEDMPLYSEPNKDKLMSYYNHIEKGLADSIKLIFAGWHFRSKVSKFDSSLSKNKLSKFSIQPTLIRREALMKILKRYPSQNLWKLERKIEKSWIHPFKEYCCNLKGDKHGNHFDCLAYPYIATAIVKGKWNFEQYDILKPLLDEYQIKSRNYD